jgi:hypothetical protein
MSVSAIHPTIDGACPRCGTPGQRASIFCTICSLRLAPGMRELEGRAAVVSAAWMQANPDLATPWRERLEQDEIRALSNRRCCSARPYRPGVWTTAGPPRA